MDMKAFILMEATIVSFLATKEDREPSLQHSIISHCCDATISYWDAASEAWLLRFSSSFQMKVLETVDG